MLLHNIMSSYGTQKPFGQQAVQLTFPTVFEEAVRGNVLAYYPEMTYRPIVLHEANDIQGYYHHQKTLDAHRMARAKVQSTVNSDRYARKYHQNYNVPKPVLGQRKYANPSMGNQADIYSARQVSFDVPSDMWGDYSGGLSGGVLYTKMAQQWGRQQLRNRSQQLDAIEAEKQGLPYQRPQTLESESESTKVKLEISQTLQAISASISAGQANNFAFNDSVRFLRLLFRWASSASLEDLMEVLEYCESIEEGLRELRSEGEDGNDANRQWIQQNPQLEVMMNTFNRVNNYLKGMIGGADKSVAERKRLSASLVKSLGFTRLPLAGKESAEEDKMRLEELSKRRQQQQARQAGLPSDSFDSDDDESFASSGDSSSSGKSSGVSSYVSEYLRGQERNFRRAQFDAQERERMAQRNGTYLNEDPDQKEEKEGLNPFRRDDTGEAQAQGLEVGLQEPDPFAEEDEEIQKRINLERRSRSRSRSRASSRPPSSMGDQEFTTPQSSRSRVSSRVSSRAPSRPPSQEEKEESAQPAPRSRVSSRAPSRPPSRPPSQEEQKAPAEKKPRVLKQQVLAPGGFPYTRKDIENKDKTELFKIATALKDRGGKYKPMSGSDEKTLRNALIKNYPEFRVYQKRK